MVSVGGRPRRRRRNRALLSPPAPRNKVPNSPTPTERVFKKSCSNAILFKLPVRKGPFFAEQHYFPHISSHQISSLLSGTEEGGAFILLSHAARLPPKPASAHSLWKRASTRPISLLSPPPPHFLPCRERGREKTFFSRLDFMALLKWGFMEFPAPVCREKILQRR